MKKRSFKERSKSAKKAVRKRRLNEIAKSRYSKGYDELNVEQQNIVNVKLLVEEKWPGKERKGLKSVDPGDKKRRRKKGIKVKKSTVTEESPVAQYVHPNEKRANNPPVGIVDPNNDPDQPSKRYSYDPRLDPQLQWSGKSENSEFDIDIVFLFSAG